MSGGGAYVLLLHLAAARRLPMGTLGVLDLPAGPYAFAGGARTGLDKRVARHRERGKPVLSHIDALTEVAEMTADVRFPGRDACDAATHLARGSGGVPVVGVGTSSCSCLTHLYAFPGRTGAEVEDWARGWNR